MSSDPSSDQSVEKLDTATSNPAVAPTGEVGAPSFASESATTPESVAQPTATSSPPTGVNSQPETNAAVAASAPAYPPRPAPPRVRIGSQRSGVGKPPDMPNKEAPKPKPVEVKPAAEVAANVAATQRRAVDERAPSKKTPPPSARTKLTAEQELEFVEALGGMTLEELVAEGAMPSAPGELEADTRRQGRVVGIHRDNVFLDLGASRQGVLPLKNFPQPPEVGTILEVVVARLNQAEGLYELTQVGAAVPVGDWSEVNEGMVVEARITGHNKGGLECDVNHLRGFIPAGQISMYRVEDLSQFVDQRLVCVVTEANPSKRNLVLSRRAMLEREAAAAKEKLLAEIEPGQVREATVRSLQPFGAFVDLGGLDGLIHISQLSWDRIRHASEVLEVGQKVKVKIQKIDPQTGKISLAFRDLSESPWTTVAQKYPPRSKAKGTVSRIMEFGVFVRLEPGVEGLIHVSELSHKRVWRASDIVTEGQEVEVLVISVDTEQQRMSLSLKALEARPMPTKAEPEPEVEEVVAPRKERKTPLKGGTGTSSGGEKFGLKW